MNNTAERLYFEYCRSVYTWWLVDFILCWDQGIILKRYSDESVISWCYLIWSIYPNVQLMFHIADAKQRKDKTRWYEGLFLVPLSGPKIKECEPRFVSHRITSKLIASPLLWSSIIHILVIVKDLLRLCSSYFLPVFGSLHEIQIPRSQKTLQLKGLALALT